MNVVVVIEGREAIPVRAIPLLTDWETMSPDVVALAFAWDELIYKSEGFNAHQIDNRTAKSIGARWWKNNVCVQLDALHYELKRQEASGILSEQEGRRQWRIGSLPLLPAGVFVWKDEFEPLHNKRYGVDGLTYLSDKTDDGVMPEDEQLRTVKLDYYPFIADLETQRLVMEGFIRPELAPEKTATNASNSSTTVTAPEAVETVEQRRHRYLELFEEEEKNCKRGALSRLASRVGVDRSNMKKDIDKAMAARNEKKRAGTDWCSQLIQDGRRTG